MAAPTTKPNLARILLGVKWVLGRITNSNGYYTNGVVVDARDPSVAVQNRADEYRDKCVMISVKAGDRVLDRVKSTGGQKYWTQMIMLHCLMTLTQDQANAEKTPDEIASELQDDLTKLLHDNQSLKDAATALNITLPAAGFADGTFSCFGLSVVEFLNGDISHHPDSRFIAVCEVQFKENMPV